MFLKGLNLINFKNFADLELGLSPAVNCFSGPNGSGKTNILDSIHYLSFCKSFFNSVDSQNIRFEEDFFVIEGLFEIKGEESKIYCGQKRNQKKQFQFNKAEYERLADHIGKIPLVMVSPADTDLLNGGSEARRKFLDSVIAQFDRAYLDDLMSYNRVLTQRNALLKSAAVSRRPEAGVDYSMLEVFDGQLESFGMKVYQKRKEFLSSFIPLFMEAYAFISDEKEVAGLDYISKLNECSFSDLLRGHLQRDLAMQYTTAGIHRDDLDFTLDGRSARKFASQGQQKSILIALRLAQYQYIRELKGIKPILLLDDLSAKLDEMRIQKLMELVNRNTFGQIFITDTDPARVRMIFSGKGSELKVFHVENGRVNIHEHVGA